MHIAEIRLPVAEIVAGSLVKIPEITDVRSRTFYLILSRLSRGISTIVINRRVGSLFVAMERFVRSKGTWKIELENVEMSRIWTVVENRNISATCDATATDRTNTSYVENLPTLFASRVILATRLLPFYSRLLSK